MKLVPEFTGWWPDIGKKLPMEISVRKGLDRYGCKTSENTLREFPLVIATVAKVSRKRGLWLVVRVNKRIINRDDSQELPPEIDTRTKKCCIYNIQKEDIVVE